MNELVTTEFLGSLAGMAAVASLIVQVLKSSLGVNPRWLNLLVSFALSVVYTCVLQRDLSSAGIVLMLINGFVVTAASTGTYEYIGKPVIQMLDGGDK